MGFVPNLKYIDHDVIEVTKFPDLAKEFYMDKKGQLRKEF
jgi:hypothetical protein